jgi:hypothetical protein
MLITGSLLLPLSESAAGGNYNLRYLSATARQSFTPFPAVQTRFMQTTPGLNLHHGTAYTLYVPGAGFLWSDTMMWKQSLPDGSRFAGNHHNEETGKAWSVEGSYRVFFQDKFGERYPWEVREFSPHIQKRRASLAIQAGSTVRLYDPMADRYLCVIPGETVVSEAGYFNIDDSKEQTPSRVRVG